MVQLTTGTPQEAREFEAWATQHGVAYLDGAIAGYPKDIGTPEGMILYAGSRAVFDATQPVLRSLGGHALFAGEKIGAASALDGGLIGYLVGTVLAFLHGAALCEAEGVALDTYLSIVLQHVMPGLVTPTMQASVEMIQKGSYYADAQAPLDLWVAGIGPFVQFSRASGVDSTYLEGVLGYLQQAIAQGHGQDELPAVFEIFRKKAGSTKTE